MGEKVGVSKTPGSLSIAGMNAAILSALSSLGVHPCSIWQRVALLTLITFFTCRSVTPLLTLMPWMSTSSRVLVGLCAVTEIRFPGSICDNFIMQTILENRICFVKRIIFAVASPLHPRPFPIVGEGVADDPFSLTERARVGVHWHPVNDLR